MVGFDYNGIANVGNGLLEHLNNLRFLYFNNNACTKGIYNLHAMDDKINVEHIKEVRKVKCPPTPEMIALENQPRNVLQDEIEEGEKPLDLNEEHFECTHYDYENPTTASRVIIVRERAAVKPT